MQPRTLNAVLSLVLRLTAAVILLQTLFFKFTAADESVYIFSKLGMEPWGRIGSGVVELIASVLLLIPRTIVVGAFMAAGTMAGAIFFHLTALGIEVKGDGGLLFFYALLVFASCITLIFLYREQLRNYLRLAKNSIN